ncbi:MAG: hypothetical protein LGR52_16250 [Candidatus Thiosymbion ectosymbiont of Robbea hypermnestra]|nr:hypothetical protein [Candidatus Thiosymbion ectosymbiont of Robbea hypermnestra]
MAIASQLARADTHVVILTGSPIAERLVYPDHVNFVRMPGMIKKNNEEYVPASVKTDADRTLEVRRNIIATTARTFKPDLFIVDKEPLGLKREVLPTLQWIRRCMPKTRTILGLRDILDDARTVLTDWTEKGMFEVLDRLYDEIWIYGLREFYDAVAEYAIPGSISRKICFTGYISRRPPEMQAVCRVKRDLGVRQGEKLVVITAGGGGDGYAVFDHYLAMLENRPLLAGVKTFLITGPFLPFPQRREIYQRAGRLGIVTAQFFSGMEKVLAAADLVIGMGGYNTVCEILSQGTVSLIIPREVPRKEQLIRARVFNKQKLVDYIPWSSVNRRVLREKIVALLNYPEPYHEAITRFEMRGLETMRQRLDAYRNYHS